jgi:hypothetical protein
MEKKLEPKKDPKKSLVSKSGSPYLDRVRQQIIEAYSPEYVQKKVGELMEATDERETRTGMTIRNPNWKARADGLKTLLQLTGMEDKEQSRVSNGPSKIIVVVNGGQDVKVKAESEGKKDVLEVKDESKKV